MSTNETGASESSPLLNEHTNGGHNSTDKSTTQKPDSEIEERCIGNDEDLERQGLLADRENEEECEGRQEQFEGIPEMRKFMKYILPALGIGIFLSAADQTIIVSSYGKIGSELKALSNTSWIATAYFLTLTSFQPLYGKLSDIFSRKSCLLFAYTIFGIGSVLCGLSRSMGELIAARAFAGIGGGGMTTVVSILLSDIVPLRERGKWQGYLNIIYATGSGAGAPLGGILVDHLGWRWAFVGQGPLCLIAIIAVAVALQMPTKDADKDVDDTMSSSWYRKLRRVDFLGAFVLVFAVFALLLALDHGSNVSWKDKWTISALCVAVLLFALFIYVELKIASEPFAPGHIIFERSLFACYLCNFFSFGGWLAAIFYVPLYFQAVGRRSATEAGVLLIPAIIAGVVGSLSAGFYMQKTGKYRVITICTYTGLTLGLLLLVMSSGLVVSSISGIIIATMICGFSNGIGVTTSLIALIANASRADQAVVTACSYLFRSLGSVFGVSLSATVVNSALRSLLERSLPSGSSSPSNGNSSNATDAAEIAARVRNSLEYVRTLDPSLRAIVRDCYAKATRVGFGLQVVIVFGAAVSAWFIREKRLSKD